MLSGAKKPTLLPILMVNFIGSLGISIVVPFLIFLVQEFKGSSISYGVLMATYSGFQVIGAPILGRWSDKDGRRKILLLSQGGTLLAWCLFLCALLLPVLEITDMSGMGILTLPLLLLFVARAIDGLTGGNISVANAYLADISTPENRKANFGKMAVAQNLGFVMGPALGGLLGGTSWGEQLPVLAAILISIIALVFIYFALPESLNKQGNAEEPRSPRQLSGWRELLCLPMVGFLIVCYFLLFLGFNFFYTAFPVHGANTIGWTVTELGLFFSFMSLLMVIVQGPLLSWLNTRVSDENLMLFGNLVLATAFLAFAASKEGIWAYIGAIGFALGNGLMWPSFMSILSKYAGPKYQGAVQGYATSAGSVASIIGLVFGGILYGAIGPITFYISGILFFLVALLCLRFRFKAGFPFRHAESDADSDINTRACAYAEGLQIESTK